MTNGQGVRMTLCLHSATGRGRSRVTSVAAETNTIKSLAGSVVIGLASGDSRREETATSTAHLSGTSEVLRSRIEEQSGQSCRIVKRRYGGRDCCYGMTRLTVTFHHVLHTHILMPIAAAKRKSGLEVGLVKSPLTKLPFAGLFGLFCYDYCSAETLFSDCSRVGLCKTSYNLIFRGENRSEI